jgi:hypothetical protein
VPPPDVVPCVDACAASACAYEGYACGTYHDVGGTPIDCGPCAGVSLCDVGHRCVIDRDPREDNDLVTRATWLGDFDDVDDPFVRIEHLSIDSLADEDWFQLRVHDGLDLGNPRVAIALDVAVRHELAVWFRCDSANVASRVRCGAASQNAMFDPALGLGCVIDAIDAYADVVPYCDGIVDSGTLTFRIRAHDPPRGELYSVRVAVD